MCKDTEDPIKPKSSKAVDFRRTVSNSGKPLDPEAKPSLNISAAP